MAGRDSFTTVQAEKIVVRVPTDMANALIRSGQATPIPQLRSGDDLVPAIAVVAIQVATTLITLAQGPTTARDLAQMLLSWRGRKEAVSTSSVSITVRGPNGRITAELRKASDADELADLIALAFDE